MNEAEERASRGDEHPQRSLEEFPVQREDQCRCEEDGGQKIPLAQRQHAVKENAVASERRCKISQCQVRALFTQERIAGVEGGFHQGQRPSSKRWDEPHDDRRTVVHELAGIAVECALRDEHADPHEEAHASRNGHDLEHERHATSEAQESHHEGSEEGVPRTRTHGLECRLPDVHLCGEGVATEGGEHGHGRIYEKGVEDVELIPDCSSGLDVG
mmetsp:Transcript_114757/g.324323  ORF Transcript_114757/g.324323 Transcript_114757/m.324323 type:complete len:215 (+) Transcript_114757:372-1016(+)